MLDSAEILIRALLEEGVLDEQKVKLAERVATERGVSITDAVVAAQLVPARTLAIVRASLAECPYVDLAAFEIDISNAAVLPRTLAERVGAFPLFRSEELTTVGVLDPLNLRGVDQVRQAIKTDIDVVLCDPDQLQSLIERAYSMSAAAREDDPAAATHAEDLTTGQEPIVAAVNQIIAAAVDEGASDIHINPDEHALHLRYRIDGVLQTRQGPPLKAHAGLVQRLKVMAGLDLTQTRKPQDGKFRFARRGSTSGAVEVRMSSVPTVNGENVVLRLLRPSQSIRGFEDLGIGPDERAVLEKSIARPYGMVLVTGPTGSGKTTTLFTAINSLNTPDRNILTIEDPVEIRMPMVRQTQVNSEIGLSFAATLRAMLRQDPDVILVGEIRDPETAQIAVQASLTGHLVLSTLHTNDAVGAVSRLRDLGVPNFAINSALLCVVAQRLVRKVCQDCAKPDRPDAASIRRFGLTPEQCAGLRRGAGCPRCMSAGFRGRIGVYETLDMTPDVQAAVERGESAAEIRGVAASGGMRLMWEDGVGKALQGLTTLEELSRLVASVDVDNARPRQRAAA